MDQILKTCKVHGPLTLKDVKPAKNKTKDGVVKIYYKCRICFKQKDLEYWRKHKEQRLQASREYKARNKASYLTKQKIYEAEHRANMSDRYIKKLLWCGNKLNYTDLNLLPELVQLKRAILGNKRETKLNYGHKKHIRFETACNTNLKQVTEQED